MRRVASVIVGLGVLGAVACEDLTDPESTLGWALTAFGGDATVVQGAAWALGSTTFSASDIQSFEYQNNRVNVAWRASNGATLRVYAPSAPGTYPLVDFASADKPEASVSVSTATGAFSNATGSVTIVRGAVQGNGEDRLVDFAATLTSANTSLGALSGSGSACVDRHSSATCGTPIVASGGSGGTGGAGVCENRFTITSLAGLYPTGAVTSPRAVPATGLRTSGSSGDPAIVLNSTERIEGQVRYQVQLLIPSTQFRVGTVNVFDNNLTTNVLEGGVAVLVYSIGTASNGVNVTDSFRSNHDFGRNQDMGDIFIDEIGSKVKGRFTFTAVGNGYPSLNQFRAQVDTGRFCVDP